MQLLHVHFTAYSPSVVFTFPGFQVLVAESGSRKKAVTVVYLCWDLNIIIATYTPGFPVGRGVEACKLPEI